MTIYLVACGKEKVQHNARARDMYIGGYFKACLSYALSQESDGVYIISAKYGIVELDEIISPYDVLMGDNDSIDVDTVLHQATEKGLLYESIIVLGGKKYLSFVRKIWDNASSPLNGGLLSQISWLNKQTELVKLKKQMELWK